MYSKSPVGFILAFVLVCAVGCGPKPVQVVQQMAIVEVQLTKDTDPRAILSAVPFIYVEHKLLDKTANAYSYIFDIRDDYRANLVYSLYAIKEVVMVDGNLRPPPIEKRGAVRARKRVSRQ